MPVYKSAPCTHTFIPRGNFVSTIHMPWKMGGMQRTQKRTHWDMGRTWEAPPDSNQSSKSTCGVWNCEASMLLAVPPYHKDTVWFSQILFIFLSIHFYFLIWHDFQSYWLKCAPQITRERTIFFPTAFCLLKAQFDKLLFIDNMFVETKIWLCLLVC